MNRFNLSTFHCTLTFLIAACATSVALSATPEDRATSITITFVGVAPHIDGHLEELWNSAPVIDDLRQIKPDNGAPASEKTEIRLMYDHDTLYIGARVWDSRGPDAIAAKVMQHGQRFQEDDRVAFIIDPFGGGRSGYRFEVNANGVRHESLFLGSDFQPEWTTIWDTATTIDAEGWTLEVAIPFKSLPFDPRITTWNFNVGRAIRARGEESVWVSRNRSWLPGIAGEVTGFADLQPPTGPDIKPGISMSKLKVASKQIDDSRIEPSLEASYRFTPSLAGALTINTDFSATEVDDRQVNLTRFSLFTPEKRDFFLNDSDLFEFGRIGEAGYFDDFQSAGRSLQENGRPFFSRRIGLGSTGEPVELIFGTKISGRIGRFSIGGLAIREDDYSTANGSTINASNIGVLRVAANVLSESKLGMIVTAGDPNSNLGNSLVGTDFLYRNTRVAGSHTLEAELWYQQSQTEGRNGRNAAFGAGLRVPNGSGLRGALGFRQIQENFFPALGFVSRPGVNDINGSVGYTHQFRNGFMQSIYSGVDADRVTRLQGNELQTQTISLLPMELTLSSQESVKVTATFNKENVPGTFTIFPDPVRPVTVAAGNYSYVDYEVDISSAQQRELAGELTYRRGDFYNGSRTSIESELTWRPSRHFAIALAHELNSVTLPTGNFISRLARMKTEVPFTVNLAWITFVQYDNVSDVLGAQTRLRWIPRAGSEVLFAVNQNYVDWNSNQHFELERTELTAKANYTIRF